MSADDDPDPSLVALAERLQGICLGRGLTIATAESCTGGRIAATVTAVAGSSGYFLGGLVSYSDRMKRDLLGVPQRALDEHGAVSAQVARAMAEGVRARVGADVAVAVTGVAGPGGGSDAKPVGLTYIAVADDGGAEVRRFAWTGDRASNQRAATSAALEWLIVRCETAAATGIRGRGPRSSAPTERTA